MFVYVCVKNLVKNDCLVDMFTTTVCCRCLKCCEGDMYVLYVGKLKKNKIMIVIIKLDILIKNQNKFRGGNLFWLRAYQYVYNS